MGSYLSPLQLGYGTPLGVEAAIHSARLYLQDLPINHVLVKLDFKNAFNTVRQDKVLEAASEFVPELFLYLYSCYSAPSMLCLGETILFSAEGFQQGDPLGPFLFCLVIHPLVLHYGAAVDELATHGLSCPKSQGRHPCHTAINELIQQSLVTAEVPAHLEPSGICQSDGKRPDGLIITPWKCGRALAWDVTCPDTFAPSHAMLATSEAGAIVDQAEDRKKVKYVNLQSSHLYVPVTIETAGAFGQEALTFLQELGDCLRVKTGEPRSHHHLLQRIAEAMQRGNTAAVLGTMTVPTNYFDNAYTYS